MRPTQVVPSLEDLGLTPSDPERYHFCKCPTLCGRWAQHPLGQGLHAFIYDVHRAKEVIRLETRFVHGYSAAHAAAGMLPPSTLLALHGWGERRGGGLLALGGQACELGPGCVLRWEDLSEALKLAKEGSGTQVQCSEHKRLGGVCAAFYGEGAGPFGKSHRTGPSVVAVVHSCPHPLLQMYCSSVKGDNLCLTGRADTPG